MSNFLSSLSNGVVNVICSKYTNQLALAGKAISSEVLRLALASKAISSEVLIQRQ